MTLDKLRRLRDDAANADADSWERLFREYKECCLHYVERLLDDEETVANLTRAYREQVAAIREFPKFDIGRME